MRPTDDPATAGRVVLVTGGSRGIGAACVARLARGGDRVAFTSRSGPVSGPGQPEPEGKGEVWHLACDQAQTAAVEEAFARIEATWGPVEVLVANAGVTRDGLLMRMSEQAWAEVLDTNLTGVFRLVKRAVPAMVRARRGRVILVSSVSGLAGQAGQANYAAAKAGLIGFARSLARELASRSILVNVVAPGTVATEMLGALTEKQMDELVTRVPLGRVAEADEIAGVIEFLSSPSASYMTGAVLAVDGGLAMGH
jgi:3-oxoacyl-[acyl-carrier protein] reductase